MKANLGITGIVVLLALCWFWNDYQHKDETLPWRSIKTTVDSSLILLLLWKLPVLVGGLVEVFVLGSVYLVDKLTTYIYMTFIAWKTRLFS